jgi:hypothetical protein
MTPRVVRTGEYLAQIAHVCGFVADDIWNHPTNAKLKRLRQNPHMLCTGDVLFVPAPEKNWLPVVVGAVNKFTATVATVAVTMKLVGRSGPLKGVTCKITGVPGLETSTTDGDGVLNLKVPLTVQTVTVDVDNPRFHAVTQVGHMDPPDTTSGVRMRLRNLHFLHDHAAPDEHFGLAVAAFQRANQLPDSGEVDDATRNALVSAHGC